MRNLSCGMKPWKIALAGTLLATLAACQAPGSRSGVAAGTDPSTPASGPTAAQPAQTSSGPPQTITDNRQALDLRVFLADTRPQPGWAQVSLKPSGLLYVRPTAIIDRSDLMAIQAATDQKGDGILVLILSDDGLRKMRAATAANPGLRLALVVGQTMLAAPGYASPISQQQLAFGVGSARNAELAARSVAGVEPAPATGGF